jgi:hypothetical protein
MKAQGEREMNDMELINYKIISLRYDIDNYRQLRNFYKIAELRLEIARLQGILRTEKNLKVGS